MIIVLHPVKMGRILLKRQLKSSEIRQSEKKTYTLKSEGVQSFQLSDTTSLKYKIVHSNE